MKYINAHKKNTISLGVLILAIICVALLNGSSLMAFGNEVSPGDESAVITETAFGDETTRVGMPDEDSQLFCYMTAYIPPMSLEELLEQSTLVVYGRVTQKELIFIQSIYGGDPYGHTDYYIESISILRGEPINKDEVIVRVATGEAIDQNYELICDYLEELNIGEEYLLFLGRSELGGGYNTKGGQYFILGTNQGVFEVSGRSTRSASGNMLPVKSSAMFNDIELTYQTLESKIKTANIEIPIDPDLHDEIELDSLKANLESGFFTQQEYERCIEELEQYATIVK